METIIIRTASSGDRDALDRLAALDSTRLPGGELLVALIDGELTAAVAVETGEAVADPFRLTADAVELLRGQARRVRVAPGRRPLAERLGLGRPVARPV